MAPTEVLGNAFGLEIEASFAILCARVGLRARPATRPREARSARELDERWPDEGSATALERRFQDGRLFLSIRSHPEAGFRIWAPRHGRHLVSPDGTAIQSALPRSNTRLAAAVRPDAPLAAALQGLEVLHASAVVLDGAAVAFTAPTGTGKSTLAAHPVAAGASFLTDDVLALEERNGVVEAHSGPARTSVSPAELRTMTPHDRALLGARAGAADGKILLEPVVAAGAHPLALLYRVTRSQSHARPAFRAHVPARPLAILASSFLPYLQTPGRLRNQLAICDRIVSTVRTFDFDVRPTSVPAQYAGWGARARPQRVRALAMSDTGGAPAPSQAHAGPGDRHRLSARPTAAPASRPAERPPRAAQLTARPSTRRCRLGRAALARRAPDAASAAGRFPLVPRCSRSC